MKQIAGLLVSALVALAPPAFAHKDTPDLQGEHDMSGTVSKLDKKTGMFVLDTGPGGMLHLHFPPDVVKDIKDGDRVTVHLGLTKDAMPAKK